MNTPRRLFLPEDSLPHSCFQVITFQAHGMTNVYQFMTSQETAEFVVDLPHSNHKPIIQYAAPLNVPIPEMDMPPRPQDLDPQTACNSSDSVEDSQNAEETGFDQSTG